MTLNEQPVSPRESERLLLRGSDQDVSDPADERSEGCIAKRKRRVTSSARRRLSKR